MSTETSEWLNGGNILVGQGHRAWWYDASLDSQNAESTHYAGAIPTADVARRLFHWEAVPSPIYTMTDQGVTQVRGHVANVRSDTGESVGIVSERYAVHQFADSLLGGAEKITGAGLGISSAGLLKGGAIGWVSVSLADTTTTPEGVEFFPYLMCYGSHDGSLPTGYKRVITNVVCDNTMGAALREGGADVRIRHTSRSALRVRDAQEALGILVSDSDAFSTQVKALCEREVTYRQWLAIVEELIPAPEEEGRARTIAVNKQESLRDMYVSDPRCRDWKGTAWGVVQAVNTWQHHAAPVRNVSRAERNMMGTLDGSWDALDARTMSTLDRVLSNA
jgi:phage/plasmid-like protein (TIGR03299 family)